LRAGLELAVSIRFLSPRETKASAQKYREYDHEFVSKTIKRIIVCNLKQMDSQDEGVFRYNKYFKSYLPMIKYNKYILFGIERFGIDNRELAKQDAIKTLNDLEQDRLPECSIERIIREVAVINKSVNLKDGIRIE
jgi:hypothetical protein